MNSKFFLQVNSAAVSTTQKHSSTEACKHVNMCIKCDQILEKGPCRTNFRLELWLKISSQPKFSQFLDYWSITVYYPLLTFWHKSAARVCYCCCTRSVYFHPLDLPSIVCNRGVVTWCQCYHGNGGSSMSSKDSFSAWVPSQTKLSTAIDASLFCLEAFTILVNAYEML